MKAVHQVVCVGGALDGAPARVKLLPWGQVETSKGSFLVDTAAAQAIIANFRRHGVDVPVDLEHHSIGGAFQSPDGSAKAVGWIHGLEVAPGDGLYGLVKWTDTGRHLLESRAYRYLSPVLHIGADNRPVSLHSVALTNKPALGGSVPALLAAREGGGLAGPDRYRVIEDAAAAFDRSPVLAMSDLGRADYIDRELSRCGLPHQSVEERQHNRVRGYMAVQAGSGVVVFALGLDQREQDIMRQKEAASRR